MAQFIACPRCRRAWISLRGEPLRQCRLETTIMGKFKVREDLVLHPDDIMMLVSHPETRVLDEPCPLCGYPRLLDVSRAVTVEDHRA